MKKKKVRLKAKVILECTYPADSNHYGTNDIDDMCLIDKINFEGDIETALNIMMEQSDFKVKAEVKQCKKE